MSFFVDRIDPPMFVLTVLLLVLTIVDGTVTLLLLGAGCEEINPAMGYLLRRGPLHFLLGKYALTTAGLPFLLIFLPLYEALHGWMDPRAVTLRGWIGFAWVSIIAMFLGFVAWYRGLGRGGVARVGQLQLLQGPLSFIWSALMLGEPISREMLAVVAVVVVCLAVSQKARLFAGKTRRPASISRRTLRLTGGNASTAPAGPSHPQSGAIRACQAFDTEIGGMTGAPGSPQPAGPRHRSRGTAL